MEQNVRQETSKKRNFLNTNQWLLPFILIVAIIVLLYMFRSFPLDDRAIDIPHEGMLELIVGYAVLIAEIAAMLVVVVSVVEVTINFLRGLFDKRYSRRIGSSQVLRLRLGHRLTLALEFALASDILRVAISPTLSDLIFLFVIVLLRFLIGFFLEEEFATIEASKKYHDLEPCDSGD